MAENIQGKNPEGSTAAHTNPVLIAGKDSAGNIIDLLLDTDGTLHVNGVVQVTGSKMELFGVSTATRPAANAVLPGTTFTICNATLDTTISDGTSWVAI
jgi:hypothetical protein